MEEATCERIVKSIDTIIRKDPELDEFDVIHSLGEVNKSPVVHIDHKLALESWCVKYVYKYAYSSVLHYHNTGGYEYSDSILRWTQFCLLLTPEVLTFWNIRKRMILKSILKTESDLLLSKLILTRKPKCIEAFQHRRWIFNSVLSSNSEEEEEEPPAGNYFAFNNNNNNNNNNLREPQTLKECMWSELDLCTWTADRRANNYHSWNHRLWVVETLSSLTDCNELYKSEYDTSQYWVSLHVSEHSGMHYRSKLLESICSAYERGNVSLERLDSKLTSVNDLYLKELKFNEELMLSYPEHESLFYHRRVLLLKLQDILGNHGQRSSSPPPAFKRPCIETLNGEWTGLLQREIEMTEESKCLSQYHHQLMQQHLSWINNVCVY